MSQITLKGITKKYGEKTVVDHVDLDMENGSLVSILGPSGCGKTTILRMIAGFEVPDGGDVLFDGADGNTEVGGDLIRGLAVRDRQENLLLAS